MTFYGYLLEARGPEVTGAAGERILREQTGKKEEEWRRVIDLSLLRCSRVLLDLARLKRKEDEERVGSREREKERERESGKESVMIASIALLS